MLTEVVKKYNGRNWKKIGVLFAVILSLCFIYYILNFCCFFFSLSCEAESIPGRSDVQCLHRWQKVLNPDLVKGPWTKEVNLGLHYLLHYVVL